METLIFLGDFIKKIIIEMGLSTYSDVSFVIL